MLCAAVALPLFSAAMLMPLMVGAYFSPSSLPCHPCRPGGILLAAVSRLGPCHDPRNCTLQGFRTSTPVSHSHQRSQPRPVRPTQQAGRRRRPAANHCPRPVGRPAAAA